MLIQETSREAYESVNRGKNSMRDRVYDLIKLSGVIHCEAVEITLDGKHQSISAAIRHLVKDGLVEDSGLKTKTTSGRNAILWKVVTEVE
jgi:predicted transcriptional regulator|tara:strand:- start:3115 stop:3384 length:270 start_codon:yes stop_codon:yes gene_type:complete